MTNTTTFRSIDQAAAGAIGQAARLQGADISNVLFMLRNGTTLRGMAVSSLLAGVTHAFRLWAGAIVLGMDTERPGLPGAPRESIADTARNCAVEVNTWLNETRLVYDVPTPLIECTPAQRAHFDALLTRMQSVCENATKTQRDAI